MLKNGKLAFCLLAFLLCSTQKCLPQLSQAIKSDKLFNSTSLKEFCDSEPEAVEKFLTQIDLDYPGLQSVREATKNGRFLEAIQGLLIYYKAKVIEYKEPVKEAHLTLKIVEEAMEDTFTFQEVTGHLPRLSNGKRNWNHKGPRSDIEWAFFLNRHYFLVHLLHQFELKQYSSYPALFNDIIFDWITSNPVPAKHQDNPTWRSLEAAIRIEAWTQTFYGFNNAKEFTDLTRLLMLMSFYDHAEYLKKFHIKHHNHAVMEFKNLTSISLYFPEFKNSKDWYDYSLKEMQDEFEYAAYPDGAEKELTAHYHNVVIKDFQAYLELNAAFNKPLSKSYYNILENLYNYSVYTARPDGLALLNNDSDINNNFEVAGQALAMFNRPDWEYIISKGKKGIKPKSQSKVFPWSGHYIMRNGYGETLKNDHYAFFDFGPWGTSHQHNDKLHFSLYAYGREFLCDNGRMYYKNDSLRSYFNLSVGHNVIAIDQKGQNYSQYESKRSIDSSFFSAQPNLDFVIASFSDGFGDKSRNVSSFSPNKNRNDISATHTRSVIYLKNKFWIIIDRVKLDTPRSLTAYWHFHPDCEVSKKGRDVLTSNIGKPNLLIHPVGEQNWTINLVKGQLSPYVQGWYSPTYNVIQPAYCSEFTIPNSGTYETFAWVMYPSLDGKFPSFENKVLKSLPEYFHFVIKVDGEETEVAINFDDIKKISLRNKFMLDGRCGIIHRGKETFVVDGTIVDKRGRQVAKDE